MIALASDHTGVALKAEIAKMLDEMGLAWKDLTSSPWVPASWAPSWRR